MTLIAKEPMSWETAEAYYEYHRNFLLEMKEHRYVLLVAAREVGDQSEITAMRNKYYAAKRRVERWTMDVAKSEFGK